MSQDARFGDIIPAPRARDFLCPTCGLVSLRRCGRKGLWEKHVLPVFGIFPWRCLRCRARFRLSDRGAGYRRVRVREDKNSQNTRK